MRALYVGRDDRKKTGFWWHAMCDAAKHKNAARPERACGGTIVPAHRLVGAAGAVSAVVFGQAVVSIGLGVVSFCQGLVYFWPGLVYLCPLEG